MDDLNRFFPVVPQNAPPDDLEDYLRLYADEAGAFLASQRSNGPPHPEWYVNTPMPVMRTLEGLSLSAATFRGVGQPLGPDPVALTNRQAGTTLVTAMWAQRAANAYSAALSATPSAAGPQQITTDGIVGPTTLSTLARLQALWVASHSTTSPLPAPAKSGSGVALATEFANALATQIQVADVAPVPHQQPQQPPAQDSYMPPAAPAVGAWGGLLLVGGAFAAYLYATRNRTA